MSTDTDWRSRLDSSFGDGPAHPPVDHRIAAGRRAVVRRRLSAGAAVVGVVAALGVGYAVSAPGPQGRATGPVAVDPTPTPTPTPTPAPTSAPWEDDNPVRYIDGELQIRDGVVVHEHIENPYDYGPPRGSDALDLTYEGKRMWVIAELQRDGYGYSSSVPSNGWASFDDWVADQVHLTTGGDDGWPTTLHLTDDGRVVAAPGAEVLQRTDDPQLGADFAAPGTPTGAALVRPAGEETAYFVVWRVVDGELDVITTAPDDVVGATFDELLSYARSQYAGGEGLR
jgi:hypothetical protein